MSTETALNLIAHERAPRYDKRKVNHRVLCADGFSISVQASTMHYANDMTERAPCWSTETDPPVEYPFMTFECAYRVGAVMPESWLEYDSSGYGDNSGPWAYVPRDVVAELLDSHGGAVGWQEDITPTPAAEPARPTGDPQ